MLETSKENLCINKLEFEQSKKIVVEGDMIVPDSKPEKKEKISTSGIVSIYKKEIQENKIKIDGNINVYIMYMPDIAEDQVRGLNTNLDFSDFINAPNCTDSMSIKLEAKIIKIDCKVINGRKVGISAEIELDIKVYSNDNVEIINDIQNAENMQFLKENLKVNSLVGTGTTNVVAKDNISIEQNDNLAEILKVNYSIINRDIKISYNKVLTKAELNIKIMYLTEDNRICIKNANIPVVGFIDIQNVSDENICDVNYQIKNSIIKPNSGEEHSIYVEIEIEIMCSSFEKKEINLIQDMYNPCKNLNFETKQIAAITNKESRTSIKEIREIINLKDIESLKLIDVDSNAVITSESKINSKILFEGDLNLTFLFLNKTMQVVQKTMQIPFNYVIDDIQGGEKINTENCIEIGKEDYLLQDNGNITCNVDIKIITNMYKTANINIINKIEENGDKKSFDYSIIIYIVKKGDTMWDIAKRHGSTIELIKRVNEMEDEKIIPGQKIFIPKYVKVPVISYD